MTTAAAGKLKTKAMPNRNVFGARGGAEVNDIVSIVGIMCLQIGVNLARKWVNEGNWEASDNLSPCCLTQSVIMVVCRTFLMPLPWRRKRCIHMELITFIWPPPAVGCEYKFITNSLRAARHLRGSGKRQIKESRGK